MTRDEMLDAAGAWSLVAACGGLRHTAPPVERPAYVPYEEECGEAPVRHSPEFRARAMELWEDGMSIKAIAKELRMGEVAMASYICGHRDDFPYRRPHRTQEERDRALALHELGLTWEQVAEEMGVHVNTITNWAKKRIRERGAR